MAINASDFSPASVSGTVTINSSAGTSSTVVAADQSTEGPEKFVIKLRTGSITGPVVAISDPVTINDTSVNNPTYSFLANVASVNEGQSVKFTLVTTDVTNGTNIPYEITGVSSADIGGAPLTGNFTVNNSGTATIELTITAAADQLTEGNETLTIRLTTAPNNPSVSITIVDSSVTPVAAFQLTNAIFGSTPASTTTQDEGAIVYFYLSVTDAGNLWGTQVPYTITGVDRSDIGNAFLTGSFQLPQTPQANPVASVGFTITADTATEGVETMVLTLDGKNVSSSVIINDTSTTPVGPPTYDLSLTQTSTSGTATVITSPDTPAFVAGSTYWGEIAPVFGLPITGIQIFWQGEDKSPANLSQVYLTSYGDTAYNHPDGYTYYRSQLVTTGVTTYHYVYRHTTGQGDRNVTEFSPSGSYITFILKTTNVAPGTSVPFKVTGIEQTDITGLTWDSANNWFTGAFVMQNPDPADNLPPNNQTASVVVSVVADLLTEGIETAVLTLNNGLATVSVDIMDNSVSAVISGSATITAADTRDIPVSLPSAAMWVAFRIIGAGGSGGGPDSNGAGGSGGGGQYARGIVRLPVSPGPKTIYGFVGRPARGGTASGRLYDEGGIGENCSPTVDASGAKGEINGPSGSSGEGGGGGGASSLYYSNSNSVIPIVTVGGGGGGGGGSHRRGDYGNANSENKGFITFGSGLTGTTPIPGLKAEWCRLDGGGGGGGGGAGGKEGFCGDDNDRGSKGGSAGYVIRNDSDGLAWNTFDWYGIGPVSPSTEGVAVEAPQPFPWVTFGRGGFGAGGGSTYGQGGQMGAISLYWTTGSVPSYSMVPDWAFPTFFITDTLLPNKDMQAGLSSVTFYSWGAVSYNIDGNISTSCFIQSDWGNDPINGIGEFLEILVVTSNPSNGQNRGNLSSNIPENVWTPLKPTGPQGYYIGIQNDFADATVTIRRRDNQAVLRTVKYFNISGYPSYNYGGGDVF